MMDSEYKFESDNLKDYESGKFKMTVEIYNRKMKNINKYKHEQEYQNPTSQENINNLVQRLQKLNPENFGSKKNIIKIKIKKKIEKKISNHNINRMIKFVEDKFENKKKFELVNAFSKYPSSQWRKCNKHLWTTDKHKTGHKNWGCPSGKVNDITLLDLDAYKWSDDHPFYNLCSKDKFNEYIKSLNTITIRTGHNGWHLWFKYTDKVRTRDNNLLNIDLKNEGAYGVGLGSKIRKEKGKCKDDEVGSIGYYRVSECSGKDFAEMPEELINWLHTYQQETSSSKKYPTKKNIKKQLEVGNKVINYNDDEENQYAYEITDNKLKQILNKLDKKNIFGGFTEWFKFTTAMKSLNKKNIWDEYCKANTGYNKFNNFKIWDSIKYGHNRFLMVNWLLHQTNDRTLLDYIKFKPTPENTFENGSEIINRQKLSKLESNEEDEGFIEPAKYKDLFIRSDTATGKTTLIKKYVYEQELNIISIVSRVSLADEQYKDFQAIGINCYHYRNNPERWYYQQGDNVIITIESLHRLADIEDFSDYVVYLDEFDSLIRHLLNSPTCLKNRAASWMLLRSRLLVECKQIIATDADIHNNRMKILKGLNRNVNKVLNTYKHNKGVPMKEVYNYEDFLIKCCQVDKKIVCTDSKQDAQLIFKHIIEGKGYQNNEGDKQSCEISEWEDSQGLTYILITSDTEEGINLDSYDIVVFSPKIIYGLDSTMERPVFAHYKEHTINPRAMLQQIARCRNITELTYIFYKKEFIEETYYSLENVKQEYSDFKKLTIPLKCVLPKEETKLYEEMLTELIYEEDCYNTNKFAHFRRGALEKGFIENLLPTAIQTNRKILASYEKEHEEQLEDNFNPLDPKHKKINKFLELPADEMIKHKYLFLKSNGYSEYLATTMFFFQGQSEWMNKLKGHDDFIIKKIGSKENKLKFIQDSLKKLNITDKLSLIPEKNLTKKQAKKMWDTYTKLFRFRGQEVDLTKSYEVMKWLSGMYRKIFISDIILKERKNVANQKITTWTINKEYLYELRDLARFKDKNLPEGELDFTIGMEWKIKEEGLKRRWQHKIDIINEDIRHYKNLKKGADGLFKQYQGRFLYNF